MTGLQRKYAEVSGRSLSDYINESDGRSFGRIHPLVADQAGQGELGASVLVPACGHWRGGAGRIHHFRNGALGPIGDASGVFGGGVPLSGTRGDWSGASVPCKTNENNLKSKKERSDDLCSQAKTGKY